MMANVSEDKVDLRGGRTAALAMLAKLDPAAYTRSRNFLNGAVTHLSPYLRHGVLTLAEVRDHALSVAKHAGDADKFINELGWRDYWQRLYAVLGDGVWTDREGWKTGFSASDYSAPVPGDVLQSRTGLVCIDHFSAKLRTTGYLHNHERMWMAAYLTHWLRVRWQDGARWFLQHLLDGDTASNNLSWQWVASTFSSKPYFFNRENLEKYTNGVHCAVCPERGHCPMEGSYEELEAKLFRPVGDQGQTSSPREVRSDAAKVVVGERPLLWVHTDCLNPAGVLFERDSKSDAVYVWDEGWFREEEISRKRVVFLEECLAEMPRVAQRRGEVAVEVLAAAKSVGATHVVSQRTVDPRLIAAARLIGKVLPVKWVDPPAFVNTDRGFELKRFSRYWQKAQGSAMRPTSG